MPEDFVVTPFGYMHPSCVAHVGKGESVGEDMLLRHADGTVEPIAPCMYPRYTAQGEAVETTASLLPETNGWVDSVTASYSSNLGEEYSTLTVPPAPTSYDSQVVFFFPGIGNIMQPVLAYNNDFSYAWSIASWVCCTPAAESTPIQINPGDTIIGTVTQNCSWGSSSCNSWNVTITDNTANQTTTLSVEPLVGDQNEAVAGVLEAYSIIQCSDYPPNGKMIFNSTFYDYNDNLISNLDWSPTIAGADTPNCNYDAQATTESQTTLTYGLTAAGFLLSVPSGNISVNQGSSVNETITVVDYEGFNGTVSFSTSGEATGVTASLNPTSTATTSTLTLDATSAAALTGASSPLAITIAGTSSGTYQTFPLLANVFVNPPLTGGSGTPVSLSSAYNVYGFYDDVNHDSITNQNSLDGDGHVYSANLLSPPGNSPMGLNFNGTQFSFGTPNQMNAVSGTGSPITLPSGSFNRLQILGTGIGAQKSQTVTVTYTDSSTDTFTQTFDDWSSESSCTSSNPCAAGESIAVTMPYLDASRAAENNASGTDNYTFYLYSYSFALNNSKTVQSLTLPNNRDVVMLAATLSAGAVSPTYSLSAGPDTLSVTQGGNSTTAITVTPANGFTGNVNLTSSGLPAGITASFSPNPVDITATTGVTSTLTLMSSSSATTGPATVTVKGTSGSLSPTITVGVTVTPSPSFSLSASPSSGMINNPGTPFSSMITVAPANGFTGAVTLTCSVASTVAFTPSQASCSFGATSPVTINGTSSQATLTFSTQAASALVRRRQDTLYAVWMFLPALVIVGAGFRSQNSRNKRLLNFLLLGMLLAGMSSCGGGGGTGNNGGGGGGTPAGTYTITISGSGGIQTGSSPTVTIVVN